MTTNDGEYTLSDGAVQQVLPVEPVELGGCRNPLHADKCRRFEPGGKKIGRDTWASCKRCTCTPAAHAVPTGKKGKK